MGLLVVRVVGLLAGLLFSCEEGLPFENVVGLLVGGVVDLDCLTKRELTLKLKDVNLCLCSDLGEWV